MASNGFSRVKRVPATVRPLARLLALTLVVSAIAVLLCLLFLVLGRTSMTSAENGLPGLDHCHDLPCFRGLIPGQTSWTEAIGAFGGQSDIGDDEHYAHIALLPSHDGVLLDAIFLDRPMNSGAVLALILNLFGQPTCINMYRRPGSVVLHYSQLHVLSRVDRRGVYSPVILPTVLFWGIFLLSQISPPFVREEVRASSTISSRSICGAASLRWARILRMPPRNDVSGGMSAESITHNFS